MIILASLKINMSDKNFVYLIVAIVIAHFLFGVGYLIWKISSAPKSNSDPEKLDNSKQSHSEN